MRTPDHLDDLVADLIRVVVVLEVPLLLRFRVQVEPTWHKHQVTYAAVQEVTRVAQLPATEEQSDVLRKAQRTLVYGHVRSIGCEAPCSGVFDGHLGTREPRCHVPAREYREHTH